MLSMDYESRSSWLHGNYLGDNRVEKGGPVTLLFCLLLAVLAWQPGFGEEEPYRCGI